MCQAGVVLLTQLSRDCHPVERLTALRCSRYFTFQSPEGKENPTLKSVAWHLPWMVMISFSCKLSRESSPLSTPRLYQRNIFRRQKARARSFKEATGNVGHRKEKMLFRLITAQPSFPQLDKQQARRQCCSIACEEVILIAEPALSSRSRNSLTCWSRTDRGKRSVTCLQLNQLLGRTLCSLSWLQDIKQVLQLY